MFTPPGGRRGSTSSSLSSSLEPVLEAPLLEVLVPAADLPVVAAADEPDEPVEEASLEPDVWVGCEDVAAADAWEDSGFVYLAL